MKIQEPRVEGGLPEPASVLDQETWMRFVSQEREHLSKILHVYIYRGDGTQRDADRTRLEIGDAAYEHLHFDSFATTGRVLVMQRRFKHPASIEARDSGVHLPAEWFWCFDQIETNEDVIPASADDISRVSQELRDQLAVLPDLEWMRVVKVNYFQHARGNVYRKSQAAPDGLLFFRFRGGVGVAIATRKDQKP